MNTAPRVLRHNTDAEASVLGGLILRNDVLALVDSLETDDFYDQKHKIVFGAIRNLEAAESPIDVVTLEVEIEKQGKLDAIGGMAFLGELTLRVPTTDNILAYVEIVQDLAMVRKLTLVASEIAERSYDANFEPQELYERAMRELGRLERSRSRVESMGTLAKRRLAEIEEIMRKRAAGEPALTGLPTGIGGLDRAIGGYQYGIINLLAARPSMGKSAAALAAVDACTKVGLGAHVFTLEDSWRTYADRGLSRHSGISAEKLRQGDLAGRDFGALSSAVGRLVRRPNWLVDDIKSLSASDIIRAVRREKKRNGTRCVVVDYVHLVRRNPRLEENAAIDEIMTAFSQAIEPDEAWIVCAQLNRKLEDRTDKRPTYADLRGSGSLEEKSKVIVGLYRGSKYGGDPRPIVDYDEGGIAPTHEEWQRQIKLCVIKNANGAPCEVIANWNGPTMEIWSDEEPKTMELAL